ncbi:MAG TPA: hypothetical protein VE398_00745 [Acidobacteriota bacterium]|nr:hypothetical protein [Acidobacteriota bacterium]
MANIWTASGLYKAVPYKDEAELESAIIKLQHELFGPNRIYLDVKKKIGAKGGLRNIPDGYLIDLNDSKPRLFVIENELAAHDPLRHIAVQILQFSLSFEAEPIAIKRILLETLNQDLPSKQACEEYAKKSNFRNLDHVLEFLVFESPFAALVIIDAIPDNLESILARKFQFGVEVLQLGKYRDKDGNQSYHFEPFLADLRDAEEEEPSEKPSPISGTADIDTVVVPAREDGFKEVFLGENRWWAVRIHGSMRPQIRYVAVYQVAPVSAITHMAAVKNIEPWKDTGKFVINFADPATEIKPVPMLKSGHVRTFQNLRYTTRSRLENAKSLDDIW